MEIRVRLQILKSGDSNGAKLWATALDGSNRRWFKWYEDAATAVIDAENMRLVEDVQLSSSTSRYSVNVRRKLYEEAGITEEVLSDHWHSAPVSEGLIAKVLELLPKYDTIETLKEADALKEVPVSEIREALHILQARGKCEAGELFGRDRPVNTPRP